MIAGHSENNNGAPDHLSAFKLAHETNGKGSNANGGGGHFGGLGGYSGLFPSLYSPGGLQHLHHLLSGGGGQSPAAAAAPASSAAAALGFNPTMLLNAQLALAAQQGWLPALSPFWLVQNEVTVFLSTIHQDS